MSSSGAERSLAGLSEAEIAATTDFANEVGERYQKDYLIGEGGMGAVFAAYDQRLGRQVALKQLSDSASASAVGRLAREARITARLEHPGIVSIHDTGFDEHGQPYYVMRLVRGEPFSAWLVNEREAKRGNELVRHFLNACQAVAYAHEQNIAHGDLKPHNIMVADPGETQVVDWGVARDLLQPHKLGVVGTSGYMSPEQEAGRGPSKTGDVYSLGRILHEAIAVLDHELRSDAEAELRAIAQKCLRPTPRDRYQDASYLASEVTRYLDGRRVLAHSYRPAELALRLLREWRIPIALSLLALLAVVFATAKFLHRVQEEKSRAVAANRVSKQALGERDATLGWALAEQALSRFRRGDEAEAELLAAQALSHRSLPTAWGVLSAIRGLRGSFVVSTDIAVPCAAPIPTRADITMCSEAGRTTLYRASTGAPMFTVAGERSAIAVTERGRIALVDAEGKLEVYSHRGQLVHASARLVARPIVYQGPDDHIVVSDPGSVSLVDPESGDEISSIRPCRTSVFVGLAVDGEHVAAVCHNNDLVIRSLRTPRQEHRTNLGRPFVKLAMSQGGARVAAAGANGTIEIFRRDSGWESPVLSIRAQAQPSQLAFVPNRPWLVVVPEVGPISIWHTESAQELLRLPAHAGRRIAVLSRSLVTAGKRVQRFEFTGPLLPRQWTNPVGLSSAATSRDGRWLATADGAGRLSIWNRLDGTRRRIAISANVIKRVVFSDDSKRIIAAVAGLPSALQVDVRSGSVSPIAGADRELRRLVSSGDSHWGSDYSTGLHRFDNQAALKESFDTGHRLVDIDGKGTQLVALDATARSYRITQGKLRLLKHLSGTRAVAASPNDDTVALATRDRIYLIEDNDERPLERGSGGYLDVAIGLDTVAAATRHGVVEIWSRSDGRLLASAPAHRQRAAFVAYDASGLLYSASWDGTLRFWDTSLFGKEPSDLLEEAQERWQAPVP